MSQKTSPRKLSLLLTTGRTLKQGVAMEKGKHEVDYELEVAAIELDQKDAQELGASEGTLLRVKSTAGQIFLPCRVSRMKQEGVAFIPMGPWANSLVNPETQGLGMPSFKNVPITVTVASGHIMTSLKAILGHLQSMKWKK